VLWGMMLRVSDYPRTQLVFQLLFPDETVCTEHLERVSVVCAARGGDTDLYRDLHEDALAHTKSCGIKRTCANRIGMECFTKRYDVNSLVWHEVRRSMESAIEREKRLKEWKRKWKLELIESSNKNWKDLYNTIV